MSGRSGAISHTTLHEATKGNRLPSWETTVEFAKACGADPADYRERWEAANRVVRSANARTHRVREDASVSAGGPAREEVSGYERASVGGGVLGREGVPDRESAPGRADVPVQGAAFGAEGRGRTRWSRPAVLGAAVVGAGAVVLLVAAVLDRGVGGDGQGPSGGPSVVALTPADCPVTPTNPAPAPPENEGDAAGFVGDIRLPDCTVVGTGRTVTKVWRLKNTGTVPWEGYMLRRLDSPQQADQCQTIDHAPIRDTRPGRMVDIRIEVTTPRQPGFCYVRFKMVDAAGNIAFPGSRPINFQIIIEER